ncbi:MAG: MBL fold metallo-hydrolase [Alphaproteobacteria bacterium]|nr:MBL fold metallo-hydrolase [Alphaproteobacteria bacterium]
MGVSVRFLGGAGTVTGSKFLIQVDTQRVLIDCGLFQGYKQLRLRNWKPLPVDPRDVDAIVLTHAHIDHSGYAPVMVANGFSGPVHCTEGTGALCELLWLDSGYLQEREARAANRGGYTRHKPARPLYDKQQAEKALPRLTPHAFDQWVDITPDIRVRFRVAGHILGAAIVEVDAGGKRLVFSGDLGRLDNQIMQPPARIEHADYLFLESTYGNRDHPSTDPEDALADIIRRTEKRGGSIVIPSFAVGRAQALLFHLSNLITRKAIPDLPVYLDSPMAIDASDIFCRYNDGLRLSEQQARASCGLATFTRSTEESKALDIKKGQKIIISASGMATGGRILFHLKEYAPDPKNTIIFAGFQAGGTRGARMLEGAEEIKIHGRYHPVRAEVANLHMLSAHADRSEILTWLGGFSSPPRETFIVHGEPDAADSLRHRIEEQKGWNVTVAEHNERVEL